MLNDVWGWMGKPERCEIIHYEPWESGEAVVVPDEWIVKNAGRFWRRMGGEGREEEGGPAAARQDGDGGKATGTKVGSMAWKF